MSIDDWNETFGYFFVMVITFSCYGHFTDKQTLIKVDGQNRELQLAKVNTDIFGLPYYVANKIGILIVLKNTANYEYLLHELFNKMKESKILYIIRHNLLHVF